MQSVKHTLYMLTLLCLTGIWVWSCAPTHLLRVHYQLPSKSDSLKGSNAFISFRDARENKAMLTDSAKKALSDFSGNFTLVIAQENEKGELLGAYELGALLKAVFIQRLQHTGMDISEKKGFRNWNRICLERIYARLSIQELDYQYELPDKIVKRR